MNMLRFVSTSLCATALLSVGSGAQIPGQSIAISKANRTIAISATDSVIATADVARVHAGFIAYGRDSDVAYAAGSKLSNAIIQALRAAGVSADSIESDGQAISPVQPYQVNSLSPADRLDRKYEVTQAWTIRVVEATDAARVLDIAVKAGANQSGQIDWSLKDDKAAEAAAAAKALQHARSTAETIATSLHEKLGIVLFVSNQVQSSALPGLSLSAKIMAAPSAQSEQPLAINPRRIEKSATVYAVFAIE